MNFKSSFGIAILLAALVAGCRHDGPDITRIETRVSEPVYDIEPGEHKLGLGGLMWVNRMFEWKDGYLYIPQEVGEGRPLPLLIWLHGGGGSAESHRDMIPVAEEMGVVLLLLDARHNTWDGIDSSFGPDVLFIDKALKHIFERVSIDPDRIALGGLSDGAAYALALGRSNGDLFSHLVAVAPGWLPPPSSPIGKPKIYLAHGIHDGVYQVRGSRYIHAPRLRGDGYDVTYDEFDGPHWIPNPVARRVMAWLSE